MNHSHEIQELSQRGSKPLDQEVWRAWQERNRLQEGQKAVTRMKAVKWLCIAVLLVTALFFSQLSPYHVIVRFAVALGALVVMMQGLGTRHYAFAASFAAIVLLYNPFVPTFLFAGGWQHLFVLASVFPFLASLVCMNAINRAVSPRESHTALV
ncbi:MAG: hypothetical protein JO185_23325 [Acidobacteriaceae bacterium]|nr:hypothetical protein [Acidobacteriaceae bacterium]